MLCADGPLDEICGGAAAISCEDVGGEAECECAGGAYTGRSSVTQALAPCAEYPFTISGVSLVDFNGWTSERELWTLPFNTKDIQMFWAINQVLGHLYVEPENLLQFQHSAPLVCGTDAAYMEIVHYRFDTALVGVTGPVTFDNWIDNVTYPWEMFIELPVAEGDSLFNLTADVQLSFVRCGCWKQSGELVHVWRDVFPHRNHTCDNYTEVAMTEMEYVQDPTGVGGENASSVFVRIPDESIPFIGVAPWEDLGLQTINMTCQRGVQIAVDFETSPARPHCDWVVEINDLGIVDEINIVLDWCDALGGNCLYPEQRCGPGARQLLAVCPFDPHLAVINGLNLNGANCSVGCICADDTIVGYGQQCNSIQRECKGTEADEFCPSPLHSTCEATYLMASPDNVTFVEGSCAGPPAIAANSTGCAGGNPDGVCNGNGVCLDGKPPVCLCNNGWTGTFCEVPWCEPTCGFGGCITPESGGSPFCMCLGSIVGEVCDTFALGGTCVEGVLNRFTGKCECDANYAGRLCDILLNAAGVCGPGLPVCSDHGACVLNIDDNQVEEYECECEDGWCGQVCDTECDTCPDGTDGEQCFLFYDDWHHCNSLQVCECAPPSGAWWQPVRAPFELIENDVWALGNSSWVDYVVGGPNCEVDILVSCSDMPPTVGEAADRVWTIESFCGDGVGYCAFDVDTCVCPDGYEVQPWGSPKRCLPTVTACDAPCWIGNCNETIGECVCKHPDIWGGPYCNVSQCPGASSPNHVEYGGWTCVCDGIGLLFHDPDTLCVDIRCPYQDDILGPVCNNRFFPNEYGIEYPFSVDTPDYNLENGVGCAQDPFFGVCNCLSSLYDVDGDVCVIKWELKYTVSLVANNATDPESGVVGTCIPGYDNETFCHVPICENGGIHNTEGDVACPIDGEECCCPNGFVGPLCATALVLPTCGDNEIRYGGYCECFGKWGGDDCNSSRCENDVPELPNSCNCSIPFVGEFCSVSECYHQGDPDPGVGCVCQAHHHGEFCEWEMPTRSPTWSPTRNPTVSPTSVPSVSPTTPPTAHPTTNPTANPTLVPTAIPVEDDDPATTTIAVGYGVAALMLVGMGIAAATMRG